MSAEHKRKIARGVKKYHACAKKAGCGKKKAPPPRRSKRIQKKPPLKIKKKTVQKKPPLKLKPNARYGRRAREVTPILI